ncbi:uncharacterized protein LOC118645178 isoform X2 [Monomorium pharaonis]|uniref:uncharacterized protein LOC118645178 isoform X2 n=1 Tax=Monomorium pharaonis TaxID=307658 RepID=UPI001747D09F|nr:uncharacterized protein LOC118645178 isoform X2 [Monomorium pharaonis]
MIGIFTRRHPVTVLATYDLYEHALQKEKRLMEEKSNTESESQLGRGFRKKVSHCISRKSDNSSDSSENEKDSSESNDSIPELNKNLHKQDDINENIDDNNSQILDINEIPIFIKAEDNVLIEDIPADNNSKIYIAHARACASPHTWHFFTFF